MNFISINTVPRDPALGTFYRTAQKGNFKADGLINCASTDMLVNGFNWLVTHAALRNVWCLFVV